MTALPYTIESYINRSVSKYHLRADFGLYEILNIEIFAEIFPPASSVEMRQNETGHAHFIFVQLLFFQLSNAATFSFRRAHWANLRPIEITSFRLFDISIWVNFNYSEIKGAWSGFLVTQEILIYL